jgi:FkbM family methyltransferase
MAMMKVRATALWLKLGLPMPRGRRFSQYGQDALIGDVLFRGRKGVFVDVGARDGTIISNTRYLEQALGWTGIAVEPHPDLFATLKRTRSCRSFNVAASDSEREGLDFVRYLEEPMGNSGFLSTFRDPDRLKWAKHEIIPVPCVPLSALITDLKVIHYLDIDVEGHELEVLKGIDFSAVEIRIIGVEVEELGPKADAIDDFLMQRGFRPFLHLQSDRFYSHGSAVPSTKALLALP